MGSEHLADPSHGSSYENNAAVLKTMAFIRDIGDYFHAIGQSHLSHLPDSGIRLFLCVSSPEHKRPGEMDSRPTPEI